MPAPQHEPLKTGFLVSETDGSPEDLPVILRFPNGSLSRTLSNELQVSFVSPGGSDFVPYTGATTDVDLGTFDLTTTGTVEAEILTDGISTIQDGTGVFYGGSALSNLVTTVGEASLTFGGIVIDGNGGNASSTYGAFYIDDVFYGLKIENQGAGGDAWALWTHDNQGWNVKLGDITNSAGISIINDNPGSGYALYAPSGTIEANQFQTTGGTGVVITGSNITGLSGLDVWGAVTAYNMLVYSASGAYQLDISGSPYTIYNFDGSKIVHYSDKWMDGTGSTVLFDLDSGIITSDVSIKTSQAVLSDVFIGTDGSTYLAQFNTDHWDMPSLGTLGYGGDWFAEYNMGWSLASQDLFTNLILDYSQTYTLATFDTDHWDLTNIGDLTATGAGTFSAVNSTSYNDSTGTYNFAEFDSVDTWNIASNVYYTGAVTFDTSSVWFTGNVRCDNLLDEEGTNTIQLLEGYLVYKGGVAPSIDWVNSIAYDVLSGTSINWNTRQLFDQYGNTQIDFSSGYANGTAFGGWFNDQSNFVFLKPYERELLASDGSSVMLNWANDGTVDFQDNLITTSGKIKAGATPYINYDTKLSVRGDYTYNDGVGIGATIEAFMAPTDEYLYPSVFGQAVYAETTGYEVGELYGVYGGVLAKNRETAIIAGLTYAVSLDEGVQSTTVDGINIYTSLAGTGTYATDVSGVNIRANNIGVGASADNVYGLLIGDQTGGTNNYAIRTGKGKVITEDSFGFDFYGLFAAPTKAGIHTITNDTTEGGFGLVVVNQNSDAANSYLAGGLGYGVLVDGQSSSYGPATAYGSYGYVSFDNGAYGGGVALTGNIFAQNGSVGETFIGVTASVGSYDTSIIDNAVGVDISVGTVGINNGYGIRIDNIGATNAWAIKTGTGLVEFGDIVKGSSVIGSFNTTLGTEKLTNGTFTGNANGWTLASGWAYNTNLVRKSGDGTGTLTQATTSMATPLIVGEVYSLTYTISNRTVGSVTPSCGGATLKTRSANGTYTEIFLATATTALAFTPTNTARFYIDTISLKRYTDGYLFAGAGVATEKFYGSSFAFGTYADTDIALNFTGTTNSGLFTWMEDEDYFKFSDGLLIDSAEEIFFRDTAISMKSADDGHLDLTADISHDFIIGSTEQIVLSDGKLAPTTDSDIDLGASDKFFKDAYIDTVRAKHYAADGTAPVANGTYTVGIGGTANGTITIKDGIITAVQEAVA